MLAIDTASTYPEIQLLYTGLMTPGKICYKVYQIATMSLGLLILQRISCTPLKRFIRMTYTTKVILPESHWEVYWLAFLCKRGAVFLT